MKHFILLALFFLATLVVAQQPRRLRSIVTLNGDDTVDIQQFDEKQHLIFRKIYPQNGFSQILTYTYTNDQLTNYTWSDSHSGFEIHDYSYDLATQTRSCQVYESQGKIENLMSYNDAYSLQQSPEYLNTYQKEKGFLRERVTYQDTLVTGKIQFKQNGDTLEIEEYSYTGNFLTSIKQTIEHNHAFNERIYHYDE
ncbi:MAG TPA: hypothetical protein VK750_03730, partial [Cytophagaceae bacterium]|nr:hypothetical protein [Cytophagaceae bacterium]